jgi:hypothetical protein
MPLPKETRTVIVCLLQSNMSALQTARDMAVAYGDAAIVEAIDAKIKEVTREWVQ